MNSAFRALELRATPLRICVLRSVVDLGLEGLDRSDDFIEGWCVTDDHFPHPGIVFSKSDSEIGVWGQAQRTGLGLVVVCPGGLEEYRFVMSDLGQQIKLFEGTFFGFMPNQLPIS